MKIALISDIHGNFEALKAVVDDAEKQEVDHLLCLGDIVGYGPDPAECVELIYSLGCIAVQGKIDRDSAHDWDLTSLDETLRQSVEWTRKQLSNSQREWLGNLPMLRNIGRFSISNELPRHLSIQEELSDLEEINLCLMQQRTALCFVGHTHTPGIFEHRDGMSYQVNQARHTLNEEARTLIQVGSAGQPRDGDWRAAYTIFDRVERTIEQQRVEYEVAKTQDRLSSHGLPEELAARLLTAA